MNDYLTKPLRELGGMLTSIGHGKFQPDGIHSGWMNSAEMGSHRVVISADFEGRSLPNFLGSLELRRRTQKGAIKGFEGLAQLFGQKGPKELSEAPSSSRRNFGPESGLAQLFGP